MTENSPHSSRPTSGSDGAPDPPPRPRGSITVHPLADQPVGGIPSDTHAIRVLEESFAALKPSAARLTHVFYRRLFDLHPPLRHMFPADIALQERKLADTLTAVIDGLRHPAALRERVRDLGRLHADKGVRPEQYAVVTGLLLDCMAEVAGRAWSPSIHAEWRRALEQISSIMIGAASDKP
jgi:hemoglobin-like flavoprotein